MLFPRTFQIADDSGFLAIVNADKYKSFLNEDWKLPQLLERFVDEMNNNNLIVWSTGYENTWTVNFVNYPSDKRAYREFSKPITITDGQLFLTNYEDLTLAAEYENEKIPADHNADLCLKLGNGNYEFIIRQLFDQTEYKHRLEGSDFEIVVQPRLISASQKVDKVFWWTQ